MTEDSKNSSSGDNNEETTDGPNVYRIIFCVTYATTAFLIPFGFICYIYYSICVAASGNSKRARTGVLNNNDDAQIISKKIENINESNDKSKKTCSRESWQKQRNSTDFYLPDSSDCSSLQPSFVVTRPSPPKPLNKTDESGFVEKNDVKANYDKVNDNVKVTIESEVPLLKPTLKNNTSFTKLSSLHIQFSNSTEKMTDTNQTGRRHSNILLTTVDPEFENITKGRSPSVQSNFYEIQNNRSSFSTRSTTASSTQCQSSRSSSIYSSTAVRQPPSRASSIKSTSSYIVHNIRHRISNASLFRYREEARAARISAMVIVMGLFCWLPVFLVFSIYSDLCYRRFLHFPYYLDTFSIVLLLTSTVLSPFLFAFRNRQIKKEIRKIFQCLSPDSGCTKSFYTNNFSLSLKSQTVQLLTELGKSTNVNQEMTNRTAESSTT